MRNRKISCFILLFLGLSAGPVFAAQDAKEEVLNSYYLPQGPSEVMSPDGKQVAFLRLSEKKYPFWLKGGNSRTGMVQWPQLWIKDADGKNEKMLVDACGIAYDFQFNHYAYDVKGVEFSRDGKWVYFSRTLGAVGSPADAILYRVPSDGSAPEKQIGSARFFHMIGRGKYEGFLLIEHSVQGASPKMQAFLAANGGRTMGSLNKAEIDELAVAIAEAESGRHAEFWLVSPPGEHLKKLRETSPTEGVTAQGYEAVKKEVEATE